MPSNYLLSLWVADWPVLAAIHQEKVPAHEPVAIVDARAVRAVSAISRKRGVRRGMRLRTARSVCPEVVFISSDSARDTRVFELILRAVDEVVIGGEVVRPGLVVFPAQGALRHWGNAEEVAEQLTVSVAQNTGWETSIGLGEGLLGAVSAARRSLLLDPGETSDFLHPLPIEELLIAGIITEQGQRDLRELVDLLQRMGITTLGQFAKLNHADISSRFGVIGQWAHRLVTNSLVFHGTAARTPQEVVAFLDIDPPAQRIDQTAFAARQVATQLHKKLLQAGLTCARLQICVRTENGDELQRTWRYEGQLTEREITDRVRWQLEGWISGRFKHSHSHIQSHGTSAGLTHILLNALDLSPAGNAQGSLWGTTSKKEYSARRSLTRVQHLLGPSGVLLPVLEGGRDPSTSTRLVAWGDDTEPLRDPNLPWPGQIPAPAPSLVYPTPLAAQVVDTRGRAVTVSQRGEPSGFPHQLIAKTEKHLIIGWAGPWISEERWWEGQQARSRFQFLLEDKRAVLAVYCANQWQVEASYD